MVEKINGAGLETLFVVDSSGKLLASVTDGDVRRALLEGHGLESPANTVFNTAFRKITEGDSSERGVSESFEQDLRDIPVVDGKGRLLRIEVLRGARESSLWANTVVIMAGGKGMRLRPLTEDTPKPMLLVGGKPILEHIIDNLRNEGFSHIALAINYLGEQVESYFQDGSRFGVNIRYLKETHELGTAGALSLLGDSVSSPVLVINGDLLLSASYGRMLRYHTENSAAITVGAKIVETPIPYGVLATNGQIIEGIEEKPVHRDLVNAGVYVLNPEVFASLSADQATDMPQLIAENLHGGRALAFPIHETWADLGSPGDLRRAQAQW